MVRAELNTRFKLKLGVTLKLPFVWTLIARIRGQIHETFFCRTTSSKLKDSSKKKARCSHNHRNKCSFCVVVCTWILVSSSVSVAMTALPQNPMVQFLPQILVNFWWNPKTYSRQQWFLSFKVVKLTTFNKQSESRRQRGFLLFFFCHSFGQFGQWDHEKVD